MNYFKYREFACKCGCKLDNVAPEFLEKLNKVRHACGFPFIVTSGCRCAKHNKEVGGSPNSDHLIKGDLYCHGVDILADNSQQRYQILKYAIRYFDRIGIGKDFIHLGDWEENPGGVVWLY